MTILTLNDNDMTELLHQQLSTLQQEVANLPFNQALLQETLPLRLYVGQLEAYLTIHRTLEAQLKSHAHPAIEAIWRTEMARTMLLEQDLSNFQTDIPTAPLQRAMSTFVHYVEKSGQTNPLYLIGVLYALHSLAWETQAARQHLQHTFSLQDKGVAYFSAYHGEAAMQWKTFKQRMNITITDPLEKQIIIEHAQETFRYIKELLKVLWQSR
ncbi:MAG: biliverdin-producing heme oxygenase [Thiotrichaceae bacterium]